jgi:hypothetical protein
MTWLTNRHFVCEPEFLDVVQMDRSIACRTIWNRSKEGLREWHWFSHFNSPSDKDRCTLLKLLVRVSHIYKSGPTHGSVNSIKLRTLFAYQVLCMIEIDKQCRCFPRIITTSHFLQQQSELHHAHAYLSPRTYLRKQGNLLAPLFSPSTDSGSTTGRLVGSSIYNTFPPLIS